MLSERKTFLAIILFIFIFSLGLALFTNIAGLQKNFLFADEATYYMIADSLAQDYDLEYTRNDLIHYYRAFNTDPKGIFLKKGKEGRIFYGKSFAYPLFAAPFVRFLGANGFLVLHSLLLFLILLAGFFYLLSNNQGAVAFLGIFTFMFASVAGVYFLWMTPEFFNLALVFLALFLWTFKYTHRSPDQTPRSRLQRLLFSDFSDYLACVLVGVAVFAKPPNLVLMGPLVLFTLVKKKAAKALLMIVFFSAVAFVLFGLNQVITGDWNYQGGERKTFYGDGGYPLEKEHLTFDSAIGGSMTSEGYSEKHVYYPRVYLANLFYYFFGRFTGLMWYFFPAVLALILFVRRKKSLLQWMILAAIVSEILLYILLMPDNYAGTPGGLANRYFLSIYPLFFFLIPLELNIKEISLSWLVAAIFIAQILVNPLQHSHFPATHAKKFPLKLLPPELTLINELPTNTNPKAHRQEVGMKYTWLYFLDDNFIPRTTSELEKTGFWTRGPHPAEMIMKTWYPIKKITFHLLSNPRMKNAITIRFAGEKQTVELGSKARTSVSFSPRRVFRMNEWIHLYRLSVKAEKGSIPHFEEEKSDERRYLGVYFEIEIIPEYMPD